MDPMTGKVLENIKFLQKVDKEGHIKVDDLWEMCSTDKISSLTLNRVIATLESMREIFFIKGGIFVFIDTSEAKSGDNLPS